MTGKISCFGFTGLKNNNGPRLKNHRTLRLRWHECGTPLPECQLPRAKTRGARIDAAVASRCGRIGRRRAGCQAHRRIARIQRRCTRQQERGRHGQSGRHHGTHRAARRRREGARRDGGISRRRVPGGGERAGLAGRSAHALRRGGKQGGSARCAAEERSEGHDGGERRAPSRSFPPAREFHSSVGTLFCRMHRTRVGLD